MNFTNKIKLTHIMLDMLESDSRFCNHPEAEDVVERLEGLLSGQPLIGVKRSPASVQLQERVYVYARVELDKQIQNDETQKEVNING
ncbi:hypothetical protein GBN33_13300 [Plesiomonas shigelloides]|uniref:hypothetical protein n=1 Tax=Plesiomonas shigelloides TaxID=703 RepID=UPI0012621C4B|nr:hypothetical protein [Plesiomonas shigelloides]KAB7696577.1 hypothetical protein GBN33_13300 [Plesiomonas shigelloides]